MIKEIIKPVNFSSSDMENRHKKNCGSLKKEVKNE